MLRRPSPVVVDADTSVLPHPLQAAVIKSLALGFGGVRGVATGEAGRRKLLEKSVARPPRRRGASTYRARRKTWGLEKVELGNLDRA